MDEAKFIELLQKINENKNPRRKTLLESIDTFNKSEAAKLTVKELLTSTSNIALPTMVQQRALLELTAWVDARTVCMMVPVARGAGITVETQIISKAGYMTWSPEGNAVTATDPTVAKRTCTLASYGDASPISSLLLNQSPIPFIEQFGRLGGQAVSKAMLDIVVDNMVTDKGNTLACASGSILTFAEIGSAIKLNADDGHRSDFIMCTPSSMWTAFTTDYDVAQFHGALADSLVTGKIPNALGLDWLADPYFSTATTAAVAIIGTKGESAVFAEAQSEPITEIYYEPLKLLNSVITHQDFGADGGIANSICTITPAA